jgi:hypothetical protein
VKKINKNRFLNILIIIRDKDTLDLLICDEAHIGNLGGGRRAGGQ